MTQALRRKTREQSASYGTRDDAPAPFTESLSAHVVSTGAKPLATIAEGDHQSRNVTGERVSVNCGRNVALPTLIPGLKPANSYRGALTPPPTGGLTTVTRVEGDNTVIPVCDSGTTLINPRDMNKSRLIAASIAESQLYR